ncbi:hypothetical protein T265_11133 [Opisthorchis viverrini]|uniref:DH domain-containing protein n=1 Tax=Opisthorchis viverrini TaxID=6198 RepID=A0A074Z028_OPIVI|nr:hypothetical protein T265_11133 [Opisthorchis viverrini]KER20268.1 hypothetical protein T265_11133 [Opisthorchis viverrini]
MFYLNPNWTDFDKYTHLQINLVLTRDSTESLVSTVTPFRCLAAMSPEGSMRAEILPGCPSREAEVGFEPRAFQLFKTPRQPKTGFTLLGAQQVQSFFRGWLCRRRWKQIVEEYIRSEHAESMRRRNSIVFGLVECEDEYVQQLSILVTCYLRPFRMAASSKKPIILHEDVNSIFLNVETVLFLHQFFVQGLRNKMENWPTLQLAHSRSFRQTHFLSQPKLHELSEIHSFANEFVSSGNSTGTQLSPYLRCDLFDLFLPMVGIYQEYVRNHHYSLQVLAEYKQRQEFTQMLKRLEEKPMCEGRSIESFLTYPMHQIPRYIITLHELLAHTPHDHVDRKKLEYAMSKLEQISHTSINLVFTGDLTKSLVYGVLQLNVLHKDRLIFELVRNTRYCSIFSLKELLTSLLRTLRQSTIGFTLLLFHQMGAVSQFEPKLD